MSPEHGALRWLRRVSSPIFILPIAVPTALWFGRYSPQQITELQEVPLFLQGSTDMGGSDLFAATIALYVVFGFLGAFHLTFVLADAPPDGSWLRDFARSLWALKFHLAAFVLGGGANFAYDSRIGPNDFRNMFLLASLLYAVSVLLVIALHRSGIALPAKLVIDPAFILLWLIVGGDGNTAKAGQVLQSGQDPVAAARGFRHRLMLGWHELCDRVLGDVPPHPSGMRHDSNTCIGHRDADLA